MDDIAILDDVVLAFQPQLADVAGTRLAPALALLVFALPASAFYPPSDTAGPLTARIEALERQGRKRSPDATTVINVRGGFARSLYFYENLGLGFKASSLGFPAALDTAGGLAMFPRTTEPAIAFSQAEKGWAHLDAATATARAIRAAKSSSSAKRR